MKDKKLKKEPPNTIGFALVITLIIIAYFIFPIGPKVPVGLPKNYYNVINELEESKTNVYVYSDVITFNNDLNYTSLSSLDQFIQDNSYPTYIVIDINKYIEDYDTVDKIEELYKLGKYNIVLAYNHSSNNDFSYSFISEERSDFDIIMIYKNEANDPIIKHVTNDSFTRVQFDWIIIELILSDTKGE